MILIFALIWLEINHKICFHAEGLAFFIGSVAFLEFVGEFALVGAIVKHFSP